MKTNLLTLLRSPQRKVANALGRLFPTDDAIKRMARWHHGKLKRVALADFLDKDLVNRVVILHPLDRKFGTSVDLYELVCICALARQIQPQVAFEVGTFDGNTAVNIAANTPDDCKVLTLDLPEEWNKSWEISIPDSYNNASDRTAVGRQIKGSGLGHRVEQIFGDSASFDWNRLPQPLNFVFIDGNHYYDYVKKDTENALRHVASGGCIVWHDYGAFVDVSRVVDEASLTVNITAVQGTRLAVAMI